MIDGLCLLSTTQSIRPYFFVLDIYYTLSLAHFFIDFYTLTEVVNISIFSVSKKYFRPAVRILKLSKSFKILLIERAVGFLPPAHTPRCSVPDIFCEVF